MANNSLLVNERQNDLGNFTVGRLLPFRKKRQVGPFTFIDHMGPSTIGPGKYLDVDQHPHIGLSALTYLFEGEIEHRDSIGSIQTIRPGDVGFMTAGNGVTHTERTPEVRRTGDNFTMHGYQIWVALPKEKEEMAPRFDYYQSADIPSWNVIVKGAIKEKEEFVHAGQMLISKTDEQCEIYMEAGTQLLLFGGEPLPHEPLLLWNFVAHSKERLAQAKDDWENKKFPSVPNDDSYIPFPSKK